MGKTFRRAKRTIVLNNLKWFSCVLDMVTKHLPLNMPTTIQKVSHLSNNLFKRLLDTFNEVFSKEITYSKQQRTWFQPEFMPTFKE